MAAAIAYPPSSGAICVKKSRELYKKADGGRPFNDAYEGLRCTFCPVISVRDELAEELRIEFALLGG